MRACERFPAGLVVASLLLLAAVFATSGCSEKKNEPKPSTSQPVAATPAVAPAVAERAEPPLPPLPPPAYETALPAEVHARLNRPFTGDLDEMVQRRLVRMGVTYNRTLYFVR